MNWLTQNWIWLVLLAGVAYLMIRGNGRKQEPLSQQPAEQGTGASPAGEDAHRHHRHGC